MKSVYIHIPFCKTICSYCDFCKMFYNAKWAKQYVDELRCEIDSRYRGEVIDTLYIGGGTPNSLTDELLERLLEDLKVIKLSNKYEYTIECNIELLTQTQIDLFVKYGINRVSLGVQTFNKEFLGFLNRHHKKEEVFEKIQMLKNSGITNINVDFIYAMPEETLKDLEKDIDTYLKLDIPHISTYSLIIEPNTVLNNMNIEPIDEDLDYAMYSLINKKLEENGYIHYETSNFAKKGYESKHNLAYWNNEHYYGFGMGASGYIKNIRYDNTKSLNKYLESNYVSESEELSFNETVENEFILGFRKIKGISIKGFERKFKISMLDIEPVKKLLEEEKLVNDGKSIRIADDYIYKANSILINFLGINYEK